MRRTDRLYALVEELRSRAPRALGRVELADLLEVTPRTVERDIMALQQAGVPIWSQRGRGGGYAIDAAWTLPPLNFDATEALAVIAALATARSLPFAEAGRRAEQKLLAAMSSSEASRAKELAGRVRLGRFGEPATPRILAAIERAVVNREVVELGYRDRDGVVTDRPVEAHGLQMSATGSYLVGWCRLRQAGRSFRLDRIVSARPTGEAAPPRDLDGLVDWIDDASPPPVAAHAPLEGGLMSTTRRRFVGPARRVDDCTGSSPAFARAIAASLPGAAARAGRQRATYSVDGNAFAVIHDDGILAIGEREYLLGRVGRDDARRAIEDAWEGVAPKPATTAYRRQRQRRERLAPTTHVDVRAFILSLPGAAEGPIWGSEPGFLIGTEKRTRFARFGPPIGNRVGNLLPPDDMETLVILACPQRPSILASCPERYFTTPHYGAPGEPGGIIVRLPEVRGAEEFAELCELIEDAWRDVASPELVDAWENSR